MKAWAALLSTLFLISFVHAQRSLTQAEALKQLYAAYDSSAKTARWICEKNSVEPCWNGSESVVSITPLLVALVHERGVEKMYVVASAKPAPPLEFDCHACAPAIGIAVFQKRAEHWELQSKNADTGRFGEFGVPSDIDLVTVGPNLHGIMISDSFGAQGTYASSKTLLLASNETIQKAWYLRDELDNKGAYDPTDKSPIEVSFRYSAGIRFVANGEQDAEANKHYDIEVISRGKDYGDEWKTIKPENWTDIYRFIDGKYKLVSHKEFVEVKKTKRREK